MKTCANCAAYKSTLAGGECRLKAPQPCVIHDPTGQIVVMGMFPATRSDNWCLEWVEKKNAGDPQFTS